MSGSGIDLSGYKEKAVSAENNFTDWVRIGDMGIVDIIDTDSGSMTLTLQKQTKEGTVLDVDTKTGAGTFTFIGGGADMWRFGCKTGDYTSGTFTVGLQNAFDR